MNLHSLLVDSEECLSSKPDSGPIENTLALNEGFKLRLVLDLNIIFIELVF